MNPAARRLVVLTLLIFSGACQSSHSPKPGQDAGVPDVARAGDGLGVDTAAETNPTRDGIATEGGSAQDTPDASDDLPAKGTPDADGDLFVDAPQPGADLPVPHDDTGDDTGRNLGEPDGAPDQPALGTDPPADGSVGGIDSPMSDGPDSDLVTADDGRTDSAGTGLTDGGSGIVDGDGGPDTADAPVANPDSPADRPADGTDAPSADRPDSAIPADTQGLRDGALGSIDGGIDGAGGLCCGCLCRDPGWSCAKDTCLDSTGHALALAAEAGFFELSGGNYRSESQSRASPTHRVWYSFQPAQSSPESKPLAVFFNGGPGAATSAYLFSFNTAPYTLDPAVASPAKIASNPNAWTQFANLLYVDAPGTGFSYPLALSDGSQPSVGIDLDREAGAVLRVVLRFLDRHPPLTAKPVIIVGESYGGTRATLMLDHVFNYQSLNQGGAAYNDPDLYNDLVSHFSTVWPTDNPAAISATKLSTQFGSQVLIQPVVAGDAQWSLNNPNTSACPISNYDVYQCDQTSGWMNSNVQLAANNLTTIATLHQALGVDPTTIDWLYASNRTKAYGRSNAAAPIITTTEMTATFGVLGSADSYFVAQSSDAGGVYDGVGRNWHDSSIGRNFLNNLIYVNTLITNAKYDMVVPTPAIAQGLATFTDVVAGTEIDTNQRAGITRPGWITVTYATGVIPVPNTREIRFPFYDKAGHSVPMRDSAHLLADVMEWYSGLSSASVVPTAAVLANRTALPSTEEGALAPATGHVDQVLYIGP